MLYVKFFYFNIRIIVSQTDLSFVYNNADIYRIIIWVTSPDVRYTKLHTGLNALNMKLVDIAFCFYSIKQINKISLALPILFELSRCAKRVTM